MSKYDSVHMATAWLWSELSTCSRLSVGAVLARDGRSLGSGYNGAPEGLPHCYHAPESELPCTASTHAEANVIGYAARNGVATKGSTLYITHAPCYACSGLILAAGITRVCYSRYYGNTLGLDKLALAGIELEWK